MAITFLDTLGHIRYTGVASAKRTREGRWFVGQGTGLLGTNALLRARFSDFAITGHEAVGQATNRREDGEYESTS